MNTIGTKLSAILNGFSSVWHMIGTLVLVITLLAVAPTHQSGKFVFATFYKVGMPEIASGITNNGYANLSRIYPLNICALGSSSITVKEHVLLQKNTGFTVKTLREQCWDRCGDVSAY